MPVILDTTMLTLFLKPEVSPPNDPNTGAPVTHAASRVQALIARLASDGLRILIPATVWAEFLVVAADSAPAYQAKMRSRAAFEIVPFDEISAVEAALNQRKALLEGNKKLALSGSRQCLKADRQIMAIAKTRRVEAVYASDRDHVNIGRSMGVNVVALWDLPVPPGEEDTAPLFAGLTAPSSASPSVQPSERSPVAESPTGPPRGPSHRAVPQADPAPQPQDSTPPEPPSEK